MVGSAIKFRTVMLAGMVAGTLDALAAILTYDLIMKRVSAAQIFQGIARGLIGKKAFDGGLTTVFLGILIHYAIAISFALIYFLLYSRFVVLCREKWISGILYGVFVWCVMNLIVLPMVSISTNLQPISLIRSMLIIIFCIGIPISLIANHYFEKINFALAARKQIH